MSKSNNQNKRRAAAYLLDEIGGIDERHIHEAEIYRPARAPRRGMRLVAAAVIALILLSVPLSALLINNRNKSEVKAPDDAGRPAIEGGEYTETVDLFDGKPKLIWQNPGEAGYRSVEITPGEHDGLLSRLGSGSRPLDGGGEEAALVWLARGDGSVISPYLKLSAGNRAVGGLFDYSPELILSDDAERYIERIIAGRT